MARPWQKKKGQEAIIDRRAEQAIKKEEEGKEQA
jgi:hypothetical protein